MLQGRELIIEDRLDRSLRFGKVPCKQDQASLEFSEQWIETALQCRDQNRKRRSSRLGKEGW